MGAHRTDRESVHAEYISTDISLRALALKHGIAQSTIFRWNKEGQWSKEKEEFFKSAAYLAQKNMKAQKEQLLGVLTDRWERMYCTADKLLEKANALLELEDDELAPRDLKAISSVLVDIMNLHSAGERRSDDESRDESVSVVLEGEVAEWAG